MGSLESSAPCNGTGRCDGLKRGRGGIALGLATGRGRGFPTAVRAAGSDQAVPAPGHGGPGVQGGHRPVRLPATGSPMPGGPSTSDGIRHLDGVDCGRGKAGGSERSGLRRKGDRPVLHAASSPSADAGQLAARGRMAEVRPEAQRHGPTCRVSRSGEGHGILRGIPSLQLHCHAGRRWVLPVVRGLAAAGFGA
jgi:hypothetical protein